MERAETGRGCAIDISMARVAVSWLHTFLPMLDMNSPPTELKRAGNEHRQFVPVNAYPVRDGFIYVAVGSDAQWQRLVAQPMFASLSEPRLATNEGRRAHKEELHRAIAAITAKHGCAQVAAALREAQIPHSPITAIEHVTDLPFVRSSLLRTTSPDGRVVRLPPPPVSTTYLRSLDGELPFAPAYGEHTDAILAEVGIDGAEAEQLRQRGVVA
jgi:crotonobetainyl-CoA:carnitine CoA-transferase CaiB-like acyl-CoA transferase